MNGLISDFILEKFILSGELAMNLLTVLSLSTGIIASYEWVIGQNYFFVIILAITSVATICYSIWTRFKNKFPKYRNRKVKQVKFMIFVAAFLLAAAQADMMQIFLAEGFSKFPGIQIPSYFEGYKNTGIVSFEVLVPIYCFFIFHKTSKQIEKYNKEEGLQIFPHLGWGYSI